MKKCIVCNSIKVEEFEGELYKMDRCLSCLQKMMQERRRIQ